MHEEAILTVELPPGPCVLAATRRGLATVRFGADATSAGASEAAPEALATLAEAARQLQAYFAGELREFELPLDLSGRTDFQEKVLAACMAIPYGATATYGQLAAAAGHPGAARAAGQVMAHNRLPLVVPCHRVVGSGGRLGGYGYGLGMKQALLALESRCGCWEEGA